MSNQQVGKVFEQVIRDVCDASLVDFEEGGVGGGALEDLKKVWEQRLTRTAVATFPWDPPAPPPQPVALAAPTTVPSNGPKPNLQSFPNNHAPPSAPQHNPMPGNPRIKAEPGTNTGPPVLPPMNGLPPMGTQTAQQRAASHLQQRYGSQAATQIGQLQAGQRPQGMPMPVNLNQDGQGYPPMPQAQRPSVGNAQTDGAGDSLSNWKAEVARRRAEAAKLGATSDRILMDQAKAKAKRMEGGGLMVPLDDYTPSKAPSILQGSISSKPRSANSIPGGQKSTTYQELIKAQYDGPASDDEDEKTADEDAINSDLDDPDDIGENSNDEDESAANAEIMLCTYDKVQRVKNKWKCVLKDGLMTTGGKEYVFHKAQGEFEW